MRLDNEEEFKNRRLRKEFCYEKKKKKEGKKIGKKAIVELYFECETNVSSKPRNLVEKEVISQQKTQCEH